MKLAIKGKITDAVKTIAPKAGGIAVGLAMLAATVAPVAAQDTPAPTAPRAPYRPQEGDAVFATVMNKFELRLSEIDQTIIIMDVDGDGNTTDDQRMASASAEFFRKNPKYQVQPGDRILYYRGLGIYTTPNNL
jgi:hypothetical protein